MRLFVDLFEHRRTDPGVNLRRDDMFVSQQFLDDPNIGPVVQKMRCETMS